MSSYGRRTPHKWVVKSYTISSLSDNMSWYGSYAFTKVSYQIKLFSVIFKHGYRFRPELKLLLDYEQMLVVISSYVRDFLANARSEQRPQKI